MKLIKFRGRLISDITDIDPEVILHEKGDWVYGNLIVNNDGDCWIVGEMVEADEEYCNLEFWCPVDTITVGQSTGLHDKNGEEIWEGDILSAQIGAREHRRIVSFEDDGYVWSLVSLHWALNRLEAKKISNIHDYLELLGLSEVEK